MDPETLKTENESINRALDELVLPKTILPPVILRCFDVIPCGHNRFDGVVMNLTKGGKRVSPALQRSVIQPSRPRLTGQEQALGDLTP